MSALDGPPDSSGPGGWSAEEKDRLLERLGAWVDALEEPEPAPDGLAPEVHEEAGPEPDLLALHSQLAALTQETRLLGRAASRLTTEMKETVERMESRAASTASTASTVVAEAVARARREARMEQAAEILDVRDRLARGVAEARRRLARIPRWRRRLLGGSAVLEALVRGDELALERVDELLGRLSLREVPCEGRAFDPGTMRAVETGTDGGVAPGTVLEVYRSGWVSGETVVRFAEVRVAAGEPGPAREEGKSHG